MKKIPPHITKDIIKDSPLKKELAAIQKELAKFDDPVMGLTFMFRIGEWLNKAKAELDELGHDYLYSKGDIDYGTKYFYRLTFWVATDCCDERNTILIKSNGDARFTDPLVDDYFFNVISEFNKTIEDCLNYNFDKDKNK